MAISFGMELLNKLERQIRGLEEENKVLRERLARARNQTRKVIIDKVLDAKIPRGWCDECERWVESEFRCPSCYANDFLAE